MRMKRIITHYSFPCRRLESVRPQMRSNNPTFCDSDLQLLAVSQSCSYFERDKVVPLHGLLQLLGQNLAGDP